MAIISKETFEKLTKEEKKKLRKIYKDMKKEPTLAYAYEYAEKCKWLEELFDKENLQPEPKTWEDVLKLYPARVTGVVGLELELKGVPGINDKIAQKIIAATKLAKLIELGYGGMVTDEEWKDTNDKYIVALHYEKGEAILEKRTVCNYKCFIAFRTYEQRELFMAYPENRELVEQYYMI
ncbi:MAG: hypothetical protein J1F35_08415 [Erysipelotrichales bacterium]|nr:hypothetical protein [Erysipelotrichales bacterium]